MTQVNLIYLYFLMKNKNKYKYIYKLNFINNFIIDIFNIKANKYIYIINFNIYIYSDL